MTITVDLSKNLKAIFNTGDGTVELQRLKGNLTGEVAASFPIFEVEAYNLMKSIKAVYDLRNELVDEENV